MDPPDKYHRTPPINGIMNRVVDHAEERVMGVKWVVGIYAVGLMEITKDTKVSEILEEYGDIADVMEVFGIKRVGGYSVRKYITRALTVERAAKVHQGSSRRVFGHSPKG